MTAAERPHGTDQRYTHGGCHCVECRAAHATAMRQRRRRRAMGRSPMTSAVRARRHLQGLRDAGMSYSLIQDRSGVSEAGLRALLGDRRVASVRVRKSTEAAVLAVRPQASPAVLVDATGTRRRLQALIAVGWTQQAIGDRLGYRQSSVSALLARSDKVERQTALRVKTLHAAVWDQSPPVSEVSRRRARRFAAARGWVSTLAWDDIDDPAAKPERGLRRGQWAAPADPVEVAELVAGRLPADAAVKASREKAYRLLFADGLTPAAVAARLQVSERTAERARARVSRPPTAEEAAA